MAISNFPTEQEIEYFELLIIFEAKNILDVRNANQEDRLG